MMQPNDKGDPQYADSLSPMKVLYLNRARGEFWSIEELFNSIAAALPPTIQAYVQNVPRSGATLRSLLINVLWTSRIRDADVIHVTGDVHYAVIGIWRSPSVLTIHDLRFIEEQTGIRRLLLWALWIYLPCRRASQITVISEFTKLRLKSLIRIKNEKLSVIPDCVRPEFKAVPKTILSDRPIILHVGTTPNKNLDRLFAACEGMSIELWILGRLCNGQKAVLSEKEIIYREYVHLGRDEVTRLYERCDLVSFVSLYEGFGLPILEGQAVGRPVLTSDIAPMNEISGDGAMLVDPTDVNAIRSGLKDLIDNANLRNELVSKGFLNVRKYSVEAVARQYCDLYNRMTAAPA